MRLIDEYMPDYAVRKRHAATIAAPPPAVYARARRMDAGGSALIRLLFALRGIGRRCSLADFEQMGFAVLGERGDDELLLGLVGKFWTLSGGIRRVDAGAFRDFSEPGYARAVWNFTVRPEGAATLLETETRVECTDEASRRKFRRYWRLVGPFSGLVRREMLRGVRESFR